MFKMFKGGNYRKTALALLSAAIAWAQTLMGSEPAAPATAPSIRLTQTVSGERLQAGIGLSTNKIVPGESFTLFLKIKTAEGHWIYDLDKSGSSNIPTSIETVLPPGVVPQGKWITAKAKQKTDGSRVYQGEFVFSRRFSFQKKPETRFGKQRIALKLSFQICNEALCWPPEHLQLETEVELVGK
jgi:hypothetical protein